MINAQLGWFVAHWHLAFIILFLTCEKKARMKMRRIFRSSFLYTLLFFFMMYDASSWYVSNSVWFIFARLLFLFFLSHSHYSLISAVVVVFFPLLFLFMYACTCHTGAVKDRQNKMKDVHYYSQASLHSLRLLATRSRIIIMMWCDDDDDNDTADTCVGSWALLLAVSTFY